MDKTKYFFHDLLQLLKSPPLLKDTPEVSLARELPLDFQALMGEFSDEAQNTRLGKYVEELYFTYLKHHSKTKNIIINQQIIEHRQTVGEIDLIFEMNNKSFHWELAYKFYLLHQHQGNVAFFGPQGVDRLDLKVKKLLEKQLPLIDHLQLNELKNTLKSPIISQLYLKGWLFYHMIHPITPPDAPILNPQHQRGWWIFEREFKQDLFDEALLFHIVPKTRWLSSAEVYSKFKNPIDFDTCQSHLQKHFIENPRSLMIYVVDNKLKEHSRGFVVANDWPRI